MRIIGCNDNDIVFFFFFFKSKRKCLRISVRKPFPQLSGTKTVFFLLFLISHAYIASETLTPGLGNGDRMVLVGTGSTQEVFPAFGVRHN